MHGPRRPLRNHIVLGELSSPDGIPSVAEVIDTPHGTSRIVMDTAICTLNGEEAVEANAFSRLAPDELERKRHRLICPGCREPAFFRGRSRAGRGPCFGARPHAPNCDRATELGGAWGNDGPDEVAERVEDERRIVVDFGFGADDPGADLGLGPAEQRRGQGRRFVRQGEGPAQAHQSRRLSTLLRTLVEVPDFRDSGQIIEVPGRAALPVCAFFKTFADTGETDVGQHHGYWGLLTGAREVNGRMWLNTGRPDRPSALVPEELRDAFTRRFGADLEDYAGAWALIIGSLQQSTNRQLYWRLADLGRVALRFVDQSFG